MTDINKETISILNDLIETSIDGKEGFQTSAENAKTPSVKTFFTRRSAEVGAAVTELQQHVQQLGGKPEDSSSVSADLHQAWVKLKTAFTSNDDLAVLEEAERGEDVAKKAYSKALEKSHEKGVSPAVIAVIQKQYDGVLKNHDEVKSAARFCSFSRGQNRIVMW
ncbi:PA2169 family four-helix-bundle protein [Pseudomonas syringae pv. actinidiae]|nr:PA2169 family four-helix-bundle protein [Pseudomonas syringae pv. actinidiae]